uniref:NADH-ubiquinone oxidoreductase chain 1 n=1 Tax=Xiphinema rivesi TaxID=70223 RepID=A0A1P8C7A3_9BILA|nr:NADH dehydrogenase subunit 1 [Xiphinema rivesi]AOT84256.1 NADH dehydrogenase subunit 1 [Xiphinema rivesi]
MMLWMVGMLVLLILGLMLVAFYTLLERKLLGSSQVRLGPNKLALLGVLQPVFDGLKLLTKSLHMPVISQMLLFIGPAISFMTFMIFWTFVLPWSGNFMFRCSSLLLFMMLGFSAYSVVIMGWGVSSVFSKLGSLRAMLQGLSFEVSLILAFFMTLIHLNSVNLNNLLICSEISITWGLMWVILCLMESNRAPFDLLEGESELISGFNIEMSSVVFVLVFLSEYGILFSLSMLISIPFSEGLSVMAVLCASFMLFIRSCFPRVRYDSLMVLMWQAFLPAVVMLSFQLKFF